MNKMQVQEWLEAKVATGLTKEQAFQSLNEELGIKVKSYPELRQVLLDYDQIDSPKTHPVVIECRSLILDSETFEVVSKKFDRFFNLGENPEMYANFRMDRAVAYEKADGSLIGVYKRDGKWRISTRGMALAEGDHITGGTFAEKVEKAFAIVYRSFDDLFDLMDEDGDTTFVFEYTGPENRIVTPYKEPCMVLIGMTVGDYSLPPDTLEWYANRFFMYGANVRPAKCYGPVGSHENLKKMIGELEDLQEGFIIYDPIARLRMKVKSEAYLVAHRLRGEGVPSEKNIYELVLSGEHEEFVAYFPEYKQRIDGAVAKVYALTEEIMQADFHLPIHDLSVTQKDFALMIKDYEIKGLLFEARKRNVPAIRVWNDLPIEKALKFFV